MVIIGTMCWVFSKVNHYSLYLESAQYNYYKMEGNPPKLISIYNSLLVLGILGIISVILIKKNLN